MSGNFSWIPVSAVYWVVGVLVSALVSLSAFLINRLVQAVKKDFQTAMAQLSTIENTTRVQAENHLFTIQTESIKQTQLLAEMIKEQATTNGYLKAVVDMSNRPA